MNRIFNPFGKPFSEIKEEDLTALENIAEGWYIEYKKETQSGKKIGKSVSSFANSYGGIYFIGIEAEDNLPVKFDGVTDNPDVIQNSVRGNVQPFPYFETYMIKLENHNHILMVVIPEGNDTPYIHSSGKIYRRQEAASDPISENNRHTIDKLYLKTKKYKDKLNEFRQIDLTFCNGEDFPYLEVFINTLPFNRFFIDDMYIKEKMEKIFKKFQEEWSITEEIGGQKPIISGKIPFNSFSTYNNSLICRALIGNNVSYNGLTLELDCFCNCKFIFPITKSIDLNERYTNKLKEYAGFENIIILDTISIFTIITGILSKYYELLKEKNYKDNIEVMLGLKNTYRTTLYINDDEFFDYLDMYGLPVCMKDEQYFPQDAIQNNIEKIFSNPISETAIIFGHISFALGVPSDVSVPLIYKNLPIKNNK